MEWLDESDHDDRFGSIQDGYCKAMQRVYEAEVSQYIGELKSKLHGKKSEGKKYHHYPGIILSQYLKPSNSSEALNLCGNDTSILSNSAVINWCWLLN